MSAVEPPFLADLRREFERVADADATAGRAAPRRGLRLRQLRLRVALPVATAVALLAAVVVVATGVVSLSIDLGGSDPVPMSTPGEPPASAFSEALVARVSALGRTRTESDAIGPDRSEGLPSVVLAGGSLRVAPQPGADPAVDADRSIWLVPTRSGGLVIAASTAGSGMAKVLTEATLDQLERGRAVASVGQEIVGVVPNGVERVTVASSAGATVLPVRDNVFIGRREGTFGSVTWEGMTSP